MKRLHKWDSGTRVQSLAEIDNSTVFYFAYYASGNTDFLAIIKSPAYEMFFNEAGFGSLAINVFIAKVVDY